MNSYYSHYCDSDYEDYSNDYYNTSKRNYEYFNPEFDEYLQQIEKKYNIKVDSTKFLFTKSYPLPPPSLMNPSKSYVYHNLLSPIFFYCRKKINSNRTIL